MIDALSYLSNLFKKYKLKPKNDRKDVLIQNTVHKRVRSWSKGEPPLMHLNENSIMVINGFIRTNHNPQYKKQLTYAVKKRINHDHYN